jgi:hypothetical protein
MRVVFLIDADGHGCRAGGNLKHGIGDLTVEFTVLTGRDDVKAVADFVKSGSVHECSPCATLFINFIA